MLPDGLVMARGRMISGTIGESRKFAALGSDTHRMIYLMLLPHVDREGRFEADPILISGRCLTRLNIDASMVQAWLEDAAEVGLISLYVADDLPVLEIVGFLEHNTPHHKEPASKLPGPDAGVPFRTQSFKHEPSMTQACPEHEATLPIIEVKRIELKEKRREVHTSIENAANDPAELAPQAAPHAPVKRENRKELHEALLAAWNEHRGSLPAVQVLTEKRRSNLRSFLKEVPAGTDPIAVFTAAVLEVAGDAFWIERKYNLDNLLRAGRVIEKAEKHAAGPSADRNVTEAVQRATSLAERIRARREHQS